MVLWLPLQGVAALAMPFCKHGSHLPGPTDPASHMHVDTSLQHDHPVAHALRCDHVDSSGGLACNDCGMRHLACSPAAPVSERTVQATGTDCYVRSAAVVSPVFIPE